MMTSSGLVYIVSATRTPIGSIGGALSSLHATELGACALSSALKNVSLDPKYVEESYYGCVLPAGTGQNPAQVASVKAGVPVSSIFTTVNKVCASGMKAAIIGAQQIQLGLANIVAVGGMESMSNAPNYVKRPLRKSSDEGQEQKPVDGLILDGLTEASTGQIMGIYAEECAKRHSITRKEQDDYAVRSYKLSKEAAVAGQFKNEITPVKIDSTGDIVESDETRTLDENRMRSCRPAFVPETGTVTGPNSSSLSDGAACLILSSSDAISTRNLKPIAVIRAYAEAACEDPTLFTDAPALAIKECLRRANLSLDEIDFFEINEAFSVVPLANQKILRLNPDKVNVFGGAVSLGHPLGCSGARIIVTLLNILRSKKAKLGCAAICNGGGGASSIIIENLQF